MVLHKPLINVAHGQEEAEIRMLARMVQVFESSGVGLRDNNFMQRDGMAEVFNLGYGPEPFLQLQQDAGSVVS